MIKKVEITYTEDADREVIIENTRSLTANMKLRQNNKPLPNGDKKLYFRHKNCEKRAKKT